MISLAELTDRKWCTCGWESGKFRGRLVLPDVADADWIRQQRQVRLMLWNRSRRWPGLIHFSLQVWKTRQLEWKWGFISSETQSSGYGRTSGGLRTPGRGAL